MRSFDGTKNKSKLEPTRFWLCRLLSLRRALSLNLPLYKYIRQVYKINEKNYRLPILGMNIINGGRHAGQRVINPGIYDNAEAQTLARAVRMGSQIFHALADCLVRRVMPVWVMRVVLLQNY